MVPEYKRFAVFMVPEGPLHSMGSAWLGWDSVAGITLPRPKIAGLPDAGSDPTEQPRKYGIHGTIKPPFRLAAGTTAQGLDEGLAAFCGDRAPCIIPRLALRRLGRFLALVPEHPHAPLAELAAAAVMALDPFRAPLNAAELAKRRKSGLSQRQEALLLQWGYPFVMDQFRFHITLTGRLDAAHLEAADAALRSHFAPILDQPLPIKDLALMGEDGDGKFHVLRRHALTG